MSTLDADTDAVASLYPFLSTSDGDVDAVLDEVRKSTEDKAREIMGLREQVKSRYRAEIVACASAMAARFAAGGRLLTFGNGGSSTDAQDLASLFLSPGRSARPLPAIGLTSDIAVVTALSNDIGFDVVFARQIGAFGRRGDIAVGLSTSGNSANLLGAFAEAAQRGLLTVGIAGDKGGRMAESEHVDHLFVVPSASVHRIQEAQTTLYHALWEMTLMALGSGGAADVPGDPR
ncbi:SIS domain-containing protein [Saccharopolyspora sp. WRP15-2]|uniref:SIS domain-containing protein n=1 Tax=Saccharopolyspora oryzae TaxID=2997343 RepID=A0ABT4UU33_9PSEU|nr:SIS domain-containing protein [Saccharopolyspora oryzae]MDA3625208.1 SIS domain-containing protein [Saccharopolyspora oryzae]